MDETDSGLLPSLEARLQQFCPASLPAIACREARQDHYESVWQPSPVDTSLEDRLRQFCPQTLAWLTPETPVPLFLVQFDELLCRPQLTVFTELPALTAAIRALLARQTLHAFVYVFQGQRWQISQGPTRYLLPPDGEPPIPLFDNPAELPPEDDGFLGVRSSLAFPPESRPAAETAGAATETVDNTVEQPASRGPMVGGGLPRRRILVMPTQPTPGAAGDEPDLMPPDS